MDSRSKALEAASIQFGKAWASGDTAALDALLSPTYTHHDAYGTRLDRASWLEYAAKRAGRSTQIEYRDVAQRILGDVAIVTGTNIISGSGARTETDTQDLVIIFTQVWIWSGDRWLREAFQATPVVRDMFG